MIRRYVSNDPHQHSDLSLETYTFPGRRALCAKDWISWWEPLDELLITLNVAILILVNVILPYWMKPMKC